MSDPTPDAIGAEQIAELRRLLDAATPAPWEAAPDTGAGRVWVQRAPLHRGKDCEPLFAVRDLRTMRDDKAIAAAYQQRQQDAALIVEARNSLPGLLAELDRLRAELAAAQKTIRAFVSGHADAQARIARGLALHHGVPDLSCPCGTLRCEACGEACPCSTVVALAEQGGQTP